MSPNVPIIVDTINNADQALEQDENDKNSEKTIHCKDALPIEAMDTPLKPSLFCPGFQRNSSQVQIQTLVAALLFRFPKIRMVVMLIGSRHLSRPRAESQR